MSKFNDPLEEFLSSQKKQWRGWRGLDPRVRAAVWVMAAIALGCLVSPDFRETLFSLR